jgi:predicted transglutaminase-like protease
MLKMTFLHIVYEKDSDLEETSDLAANIKRSLEWLGHVIRVDKTRVAKRIF